MISIVLGLLAIVYGVISSPVPHGAIATAMSVFIKIPLFFNNNPTIRQNNPSQSIACSAQSTTNGLAAISSGVAA